jgi:hypothetical protein
MKLIDYNGEEKWARDKILEHYSLYCHQLKISPRNLIPKEHQNRDTKWVYPVMDQVIAGIEKGDAACRRIGIEFLEEDQKFPFGKTLRSNTARALRRAQLSGAEIERIRGRIVDMLLAGNVPHEYKEYAKLLKKIGLGDYSDTIQKNVDRTNSYVMKYYNYLVNT